MLLGALVGIPAAVVAALFLAFVHDLEHWLWVDLPNHLGESSPPWYLVVGLPVVGAAVVLAARRLLPGDGGHSPLEGVNVSPTPIAYGPGVVLAAIGTLAFGAVLGPEAPLIALGSVIGLAVTAFARLGQRESSVLASAGSFSAISALFGGPVVGGVLMIEAGVRFGGALIPALVPGFTAAAVGYTVFVGFGDWGGLNAQGLVIPNLPPYQGTHHVRDLLLAIVIGVVTALVAALTRKLGGGLAGPGLARLGLPVLLLGGGLAVGLLAELATAFGADAQDVLFSGQTAVPGLVAETSAKIVVVLLVAKGIAYAVSLGSGFRGGPVFPAMFLGIGLTMLAVIAFGVSPTYAVAVGTAAGTAAMTRLLLTSGLFATLFVGTAGLDAIPAAILAAVAAWLVTTAIERRLHPDAPVIG